MAAEDNKFLNYTGLDHFKRLNDTAYVGEVKVNGTALTPTARTNGKSVNISVPEQGAVSTASTTGYVSGAQVQEAIDNAIGGGGTVVHEAFKTFAIKQGNTTTNIVADGTEDTLTIEAGDRITLAADAPNDKVTITAAAPTLTDLGISATASSINTVAASGITSSKVSSYDTHIADKSNPHQVTASQVGLGNVTNDAQVKGLPSGTTAGHFVTWGADGYTVADSGLTSSSFATSTQGTKADNAMPKSGGTFTGAVILSGAPTTNLGAATKKYVDDAVNGLPTPMQFKGTVGTSGTIEWNALPTASSENEGYTYKVLTDHATAPVCEAGDTIVSNGSTWIVIPSGDEPSGTVTNIATGTGLTGGPITTTGTISLATFGTAGTAGQTTAQSVAPGTAFTIPYVTVDTYGRVSAYGTSNVTVSNPTAITTSEIDALFATA